MKQKVKKIIMLSMAFVLLSAISVGAVSVTYTLNTAKQHIDESTWTSEEVDMDEGTKETFTSIQSVATTGHLGIVGTKINTFWINDDEYKYVRMSAGGPTGIHSIFSVFFDSGKYTFGLTNDPEFMEEDGISRSPAGLTYFSTYTVTIN